jgi:glycosyltransferase involved in cell wall biosynthesis
MNVLMLSVSDKKGGAAKAAYRLHQGLLEKGIQSNILVQSKASEDPRVMGPEGKFSKGMNALHPTLDMIPLYLFGKKGSSFSTAWSPDSLKGRLNQIPKDIIHLHWVNKGFLRIETLPRIKSPIVWTLHDMWPMTGGCHYDFGCGRYIDRCGNCPQLSRAGPHDLSSWIMKRKIRSWRELELKLICPSQWMASCARESQLFADKRIEVIPNGINLEKYRPIDKLQARDWLGLPKDKRLILFSAVNPLENPQKGFSYFRDALYLLNTVENKESIEKPEIVLLGSSKPEDNLDLPFMTHFLGVLHDDISLALVYAAVDLFVAPSVQDNLPLTVMEAIACGIPCVAFRVGGIPEMIEHKENGYLADFGDRQAFADGIQWVLADRERWQKLSRAARKKAVQSYDRKLVVEKHIKIYRELIEPHREN